MEKIVPKLNSYKLNLLSRIQYYMFIDKKELSKYFNIDNFDGVVIRFIKDLKQEIKNDNVFKLYVLSTILSNVDNCKNNKKEWSEFLNNYSKGEKNE